MSRSQRSMLGLAVVGLGVAGVTGVAAQVRGDVAMSESYLFAERPARTPIEKRVAERIESVVKVYGASGLKGLQPYASGIIISEQGHILTLDLVIFEANKTRVVLADGSIHYAKLFPSDDAHGVRILQIEPPKGVKLRPVSLPPLIAGKPSQPSPNGSFVVSIGNCFRLAEFSEKLSATFGVITARARTGMRYRLTDIEYDGELILTDAANNPGHYGGGLFGLDGRWLGINTKLVESRETNTQLSAAIPAEDLRGYIDLCLGRKPAGVLVEEPTEAIDPPFHGVILFERGRLSPPAYVERTLPNSPARRAKLRPDDLIVRVDEFAIRNCKEFHQRIARFAPGQTVEVTYKRGPRVRKTRLKLEKAQ